MTGIPLPGFCTPTLLPIVETMHRAQTDLFESLVGFSARNKGSRASSPTKGFDPFTAYAWNALIPMTGYTEPQPAMALLRDRSYEAKWSAHENLTVAGMAHRVGQKLEEVRSSMRAQIPVLAAFQKGFVQIVVPMDHTGALQRPYWRFMDHNFRASLDGPLETCTMLAVLSFLQALPPPAWLYTIGSKEYWADREETAMAQHLYLSSPGADLATRKGPAHYPEIKRIMSWQDSATLGVGLLHSWRDQAKTARKALKQKSGRPSKPALDAGAA